MKIKYHSENTVFYIALFLAAFIYLLPSDLKMSIYGPSYLGWFLVLINIPSVFTLFIYLLIIDLKKKNTKKLLIRTLLFFLSIVVCIFYWFLVLNT